LESCSQRVPLVLDLARAGEGGGWDIASLIGRQLSDLSDQPIAVLVGQGQAAHERVRCLLLEHGQALGRGIDRGNAGPALTKNVNHELPDLGLAFHHEDADTVQT
jgi:hypothetical protein